MAVLAPTSGPRRTTPALLGQARSFVVIGILSTVAFVALFAVLRERTPAAAANAIALLVTTLANTEANRRFTFAVGGPVRRLRDHAAGLVAFGIALAMTTGALAILALADPSASDAMEVLVLVAVGLVATLTRFSLLRLALTRRGPFRARQLRQVA